MRGRWWERRSPGSSESFYLLPNPLEGGFGEGFFNNFFFFFCFLRFLSFLVIHFSGLTWESVGHSPLTGETWLGTFLPLNTLVFSLYWMRDTLTPLEHSTASGSQKLHIPLPVLSQAGDAHPKAPSQGPVLAQKCHGFRNPPRFCCCKGSSGKAPCTQ